MTNQRVLITGAADGLGLAMAKAFAREGAKLFLLDIDGEKVDSAVEILRTETAEVRAFVGSVADPSSVETAFARMDQTLGGIDVLINNAGITAHSPSAELSDADWSRVMAVNVNGSFMCARAAGRRMVAQGSGSIVNISSIYGLVPAPQRLSYCVSKGAVAMMARSLAIEWAHRGVRVNAIAPGYVHTKLVEGLVKSNLIDIDTLENRIPMKRLGTSAEIAEMAVYLCSPAAAYITGQVIAVDGGWTAYGYI
jgi:NAD(P)-dependent dehydrogenase (short-subunit alcohol dehydrogenase family)